LKEGPEEKKPLGLKRKGVMGKMGRRSTPKTRKAACNWHVPRKRGILTKTRILTNALGVEKSLRRGRIYISAIVAGLKIGEEASGGDSNQGRGKTWRTRELK